MHENRTNGNVIGCRHDAGPPRSVAFEKFSRLSVKVNMTMAEAEELSRDLAISLLTVSPPSDLAVGLANGALLLTKIAADVLRIPYQIVRVRRQGSGLKQRLLAVKRILRLPSRLAYCWPARVLNRLIEKRTQLQESSQAFSFDVQGKNVALIDDCMFTGKSVIYVRDRLLGAGAASVRVAVICWCDSQGGLPAKPLIPDVFLHRQIHFYPWSVVSPDYDRFLAWLARNGLELWQ